MKQRFNCKNCGTLILRYPSAVRNIERIFCSKTCASSLSHNPSSGRKWSDERKRKHGDIIKSKVDDEYRRKAGSANRGKKFSPERIARMHKHREPGSYSRPKSQDTRRKIGDGSRLKFTPEYKRRMRDHFESTGYWIPLSDVTDTKIYFKMANWVDRMFDLVYDQDQLLLLGERGVFNCKTNRKGVVRDHKFSRRSGFNAGVFPELLRHPTNLQILTHSDNVKKKRRQYVDSDSITLEELFYNIRSFPNSWKEQEKCLQLIERYTNGEKWSREKGG